MGSPPAERSRARIGCGPFPRIDAVAGVRVARPRQLRSALKRASRPPSCSPTACTTDPGRSSTPSVTASMPRPWVVRCCGPASASAGTPGRPGGPSAASSSTARSGEDRGGRRDRGLGDVETGARVLDVTLRGQPRRPQRGSSFGSRRGSRRRGSSRAASRTTGSWSMPMTQTRRARATLPASPTSTSPGSHGQYRALLWAPPRRASGWATRRGPAGSRPSGAPGRPLDWDR